MFSPVFSSVFEPVFTPLIGVGSAPFHVTNIDYVEGTDIVHITTNIPASVVTAAGWYIDVNGSGVAPSVDSFNDTEIYLLNSLGSMQAGDTVSVGYNSDIGSTFAGEIPLQSFDVADVSSMEASIAWAAGGSLAYLSDGGAADQRFQTQASGVGNPVFTTDANLLLPDWEGVYRAPGSAGAPVYGARKVTNLLRHSDDGSQWYPGATASVDILEDGFRCNFPTVGDGVSAPAINNLTNGALITKSVWLKTEGGSGTILIRNNFSMSNPLARVTVTDTWQRFNVSGVLASGTTGQLAISRASAGDLASVVVKQAQFEVVEGQSNQAPGEYIPTEASAVTAYYCNENGNTVVDDVVTEAVGPTLAEQPWLYAAPAMTNSVVNSNNLADALWTKSGCTAALDATGLTGAPNAGTTLTATVGNAIASQVVTSALGDHTGRFFLRRKTGTGVVSISVGNGVHENITLTADYQEFMVQQNVANPVLAIRIATSGDEVEVGNGECYLKTLAEVRGAGSIITEGSAVTVAANVINYDSANHDNAQGAYYCEFGTLGVSDSIPAYNIGPLGLNSTGRLLYSNNTDSFGTYDGVSIVQRTYDNTPDTTYKLAVAYDSTEGNMAVNIDGVYSADGAYGSYGTSPAIQVLRIGHYGTAIPYPALIRNMRRYDLPYAEAKAKINELMA